MLLSTDPEDHYMKPSKPAVSHATSSSHRTKKNVASDHFILNLPLLRLSSFLLSTVFRLGQYTAHILAYTFVFIVCLILHLIMEYILYYVAIHIYCTINKFFIPGVKISHFLYGPHRDEYVNLISQLTPEEVLEQERSLSSPLHPANILGRLPLFERFMFYCGGSPKHLNLDRTKRIPIVSIHGGGFIANNTGCMLPSLTIYTRRGHPVWSVEYPYAPYNRFPSQLISMFRALNLLATEHQVEEVALMGDSAGCNLAVMVTMFSTNPELFQELRTYTLQHYGEDMNTWKCPRIKHLVALYGVLDQKTIQDTTFASLIERFVLDSYRSSALGARITPLDYPISTFNNFPRTLVIAGLNDPILESSRAFSHAMKQANVDFQCSEYEHATHGFTGMAWSRRYHDSVCEILDFIEQ
eukprot:TRINITY_DN18624_c0_g1::TRINITY_DN18624_c0_g1_i1::g.1170::m.1170 TRINITY_DN18624_c0_g1::TRINITY_DN18624_c0_g1_i1::g.1170  ORF type:complete len:412 (+),score=51.36,sp/P54310/LIPS_MOUSE/35.79/3e-06,Abhydrolase_3/PF07859.8/1.9e-25,Abhydrolase_5/PF12695.2/2.4e-09,Peptidase_S9/PF00326.16/41,Peptidase_S9/PF00326.16/0.048,DLH/PF01738.13/3.3e+03,DLH/PF01738.13/0.0035,DUF2424/PF10340.4/0.009,Phi-29_GP16_7/PF06720.6/0.079 TRINITY_DN18624_c0_g1_i1:59-1294(+)